MQNRRSNSTDKAIHRHPAHKMISPDAFCYHPGKAGRKLIKKAHTKKSRVYLKKQTEFEYLIYLKERQRSQIIIKWIIETIMSIQDWSI